MRHLAALVAVGLLAVGCTAESEPDTTVGASLASTTVAPSTTTTTLPTFVAGAAGIGDDYYTSLGHG